MAYELVKAAYLILPAYNYCILTVSPTVQEHPLWKNFTLVSPRPGKHSSCVLYVNNRFSARVSVRNAVNSDLDQVKRFLDASSQSMDIFNEFQRGLNFTDDILAQKPYIMENSGQIIGVATLGKCINSSQVIDQFDVAKVINIPRDGFDGKYLYLRNFIINPLFEAQSRAVFRVSELFQLIDLENYASGKSRLPNSFF